MLIFGSCVLVLRSFPLCPVHWIPSTSQQPTFLMIQFQVHLCLGCREQKSTPKCVPPSISTFLSFVLLAYRQDLSLNPKLIEQLDNLVSKVQVNPHLCPSWGKHHRHMPKFYVDGGWGFELRLDTSTLLTAALSPSPTRCFSRSGKRRQRDAGPINPTLNLSVPQVGFSSSHFLEQDWA